MRMSHIIPMVSDSPPPLDDENFDDWDDDGFGNFTGVVDSRSRVDVNLYLNDRDFNGTAFQQCREKNLAEKDSLSADIRPVLHNFDFGTSIEVVDEKSLCVDTDSVEDDGETVLPPDARHEDFEKLSCDNKDLLGSGSSACKDSTTDSGLCSSDISPVPKSDESPDSCDKSTCSELDDTFGDTQRAVNTSSHCAEAVNYRTGACCNETNIEKQKCFQNNIEEIVDTIGVIIKGDTLHSLGYSDAQKTLKEESLSESTINITGAQEIENEKRISVVNVNTNKQQNESGFSNDGTTVENSEDWADFSCAVNPGSVVTADTEFFLKPSIEIQESASEFESVRASRQASQLEIQEATVVHTHPVDDNEFGNFFSMTDVDPQCSAHAIIDNTNSGQVEFGHFADFENTTAVDDDGWADFKSPEEATAMTRAVTADTGDFMAACSFQVGISSVDTEEEVKFQADSHLKTGSSDLVKKVCLNTSFTQHKQSKTEVVVTIKQKEEAADFSSKVVAAAASSFPENEHKTTHSSPDLLSKLILEEKMGKSRIQKSDRPSSVRPLCSLWKQLFDLDKTDALSFQFTNSRGSKLLFKTLKVDTRNILMGHKKHGVPIFAANLGLLEPSRVTESASDIKPEPTLINTNRTANFKKSPSQEEFPTVQFDWSSSGLTNPLNSASNTLDLDFLVVKENESTSQKAGDEWDWVFESELLGGDNTAQQITKPMQPLEDILANMKNTTVKRTSRQEENLSSEASQILGALPDLSFMHARVLMFPLRQSNQQ